MSTTNPASFPRRQLIAFVIFAALGVSVVQIVFYQMPNPELDARRYIDYALNIHDHQVFGLSGKSRDSVPQPGNANSPLYPAFLALAMYFDDGLRDSLICTMEQGSNAPAICPRDYSTITWAQLGLVVVAMAVLWTAAFWLFNRISIAWLSCLLTFATTKPMFFANNFLTEILIVVFFPVLLLSVIGASRSGAKRWWLGAGVTIGLLTLTRPEYLYLAYSITSIGIVVALLTKNLRFGTSALLLISSFSVVIAPWSIRNHQQFSSFAVTGGYGDIIIAYRSAYNRMTFQEWAAAFVFWLPGHGEALAKQWLPASSYTRLGTDPKSYIYVEGKEIFDNGLATVGGTRADLMSYLIKTEILAHPLKHVATSIPLAWRGVLAGKYLAVVGLPCFVVLMIFAVRERNTAILFISIPAIIMVGLYAAVSMSIPRYNVYLIYYYALASAWLLVTLSSKNDPGCLLR